MLLFPNLVKKLDYYYDVISAKYDTVEQIVENFSYNHDVSRFFTQKTISFKSNLEFRSNKKAIYKRLGIPIFKYDNPSIKDYTILFYKYLIHSVRMKCEIHLYKNEFILGMYILDSNSKNLSLVKNKITQRYLGKETDLPEMIITDMKNNHIYMNEQFMNYVMIYACNDCKFLEEAKKRKNMLQFEDGIFI